MVEMTVIIIKIILSVLYKKQWRKNQTREKYIKT